MNFLLLLTFLSSPFNEEPNYRVSDIPEDMKAGMYAVIRDQEMRFEIVSATQSNVYYHFVVTVLNPQGKDQAELAVFYDKFNVIKSLKGTVYDATGQVIKKLKQNEVLDQSYFDGASLFTDDRLKRVDLSQSVYPYTVEYEYEILRKSLYSIPTFHQYTDDEISIQKSVYSISYPHALKPKYKLLNISEPKKIALPEKETLVWSFENIKPEKFEKYGPNFNQVVPTILASTNEISFDGYTGKMDTWLNYGKWQLSLNKGRGALAEPTKKKIKELTQHSSTIEETTGILYKYLQSKTRYVGIQLGIGGWQPFEAKLVDETGYGDCKALSNYMIALLEEAGVKGYYAIIMAGKDAPEVDASFPSPQFNHVIVAVPNKQDTIWLECTSQTNPFGYLGTFTSDRYALLVNSEGGHLVRTPAYEAPQNSNSNFADVIIDLSGNGRANVVSYYSGLQTEKDGLNWVTEKSAEEQKKWVQKNTDIPSFEVGSFTMLDKPDRIPSIQIDMELNLPRYASSSGKRIFFVANLMNRSFVIPTKSEKRRTPIVIRNGYTSLDSIRFHFPESFRPELLPPVVHLETKFGEYHSEIKIDEKGLHYIRRMKIIKGHFPPDTYDEYVDFYRKINKADNAKVVLLNKT